MCFSSVQKDFDHSSVLWYPDQNNTSRLIPVSPQRLRALRTTMTWRETSLSPRHILSNEKKNSDDVSFELRAWTQFPVGQGSHYRRRSRRWCRWRSETAVIYSPNHRCWPKDRRGIWEFGCDSFFTNVLGSLLEEDGKLTLHFDLQQCFLLVSFWKSCKSVFLFLNALPTRKHQ